MKNFILGLIIVFGSLGFCNAQKTTEVTAQGVYAEIDVSRHNKTMEILMGTDIKLKSQTVDEVLKSPNNYNPPVIFALAHELYTQNRKYEATFWLYVAQLRARYDANLCMDNSAKQALPILLRTFGAEINKEARQDIEKLEKTIIKVVDFVRTNEENYDHRWINLHGISAVAAGLNENAEKKELSQPNDKWIEIKKKTIDDYYAGFIEFLESQKK